MMNNPSVDEQHSLDVLSPQESASKEQERTNARIAGATGILALGNIFSRILGLARETVLTYLFGASAAVDAFQVAILVPKMTYDLLIGGHVNGAIVPVLGEVITREGRDELWRVVSILTSFLLTLLLGLVLLIQLFAPQIVAVTAGGADASTQALTVHLLRLTSPALIFLGLFALFSGTLYALKSFTWPAFAGVVFNGSITLVTLLLAPPVQVLLQAGFDPLRPIYVGRPTDGITAAAMGWFIGALMQLLLQMPGLRGSRLRLTFNWRHPALRNIAMLYGPVMFSMVMDVLVIRIFSYSLASRTGEGGIAYMNWATTLIQFPQGLVATAISIAILPMLASQAAMLTQESMRAFRDTLGLGLRLATILIIPATIGLYVLASPIVVLLFERGAFTPEMSEVTVQALRLYLIGLPFAAIDLLLVYAFYARKDTLTPALIGLFSHGVYMLTVIALFDRFGLFSLMIADSVKHVVHASASAWLLRRRLQGFGTQRLLITSGKTLLAAALMGLAAAAILPALHPLIGQGGLIRDVLYVLIPGAVSALIFFGLALALRLEELRWLLRLIRHRVAPKA